MTLESFRAYLTYSLCPISRFRLLVPSLSSHLLHTYTDRLCVIRPFLNTPQDLNIYLTFTLKEGGINL
jgi:hypothetical protein